MAKMSHVGGHGDVICALDTILTAVLDLKTASTGPPRRSVTLHSKTTDCRGCSSNTTYKDVFFF